MLCRYLSQDLCLLLISIIFTLIVHFALGNVIYNSNAVEFELQTVARAAFAVCALGRPINQWQHKQKMPNSFVVGM